MPGKRAGLLNDCFEHGGGRLRHEEALAILRQRLLPVADVETVDLKDAAGRICAEDVTSARMIPAYDNSAVDGYAFAASDWAAAHGRLEIAHRVAAGDGITDALEEGTAARIFTGAVMPERADTVAMQEDCPTGEEAGRRYVSIPPGLNSGANRRKAGEDVRPGDVLAARGVSLRPQEVAAIASAGIAAVAVRKPLRVAVVSTGNEIATPGSDTLSPGQVYDSNRFLLTAMLAGLHASIDDLGIVPDHPDEIESDLAEAANSHDAIVTTGGASKGEEDHLAKALDRIGKRHMWQLAVKPGRPMCFGQIGDCAVFSLPGNPVAAFVCFLLYVRPALFALGGGIWPEPARFPVPAGFDFPDKKTGRREYWRAWLERGDSGDLVARKFERDGSGLITGLRRATGLIEVDENTRSVARGDLLAFIPFSEFGIS